MIGSFVNNYNGTDQSIAIISNHGSKAHQYTKDNGPDRKNGNHTTITSFGSSSSDNSSRDDVDDDYGSSSPPFEWNLLDFNKKAMCGSDKCLFRSVPNDNDNDYTNTNTNTDDDEHEHEHEHEH